MPTGFGVIGVGTWGQLHARVYANTPGARLAAVCDTDQARARQVARECGEPRIYDDYREMLADPDVEAVSIVLPDHLHTAAALAAIQSRKHVLIEKPLATSESDCLAIIDASRANGVALMVDFHNRWSPLFNGLKQALDSGELGAARLITYRLSDTVFVPKQMLRWAASTTVAWFLASHCLDTLLWLMDSRGCASGGKGDVPERLTCVKREGVLRDRYGVDTPDFYLTTIEWRSGLVTQVENSWLLPESGPSVFDLKCEVTGTEGGYIIDGSHHRAAQKLTGKLAYPDALVAPIVQGMPVGFGAESIRHFAACVMNGGKPLVDGLDGLAVTRLILLMEESARLGHAVAVDSLYV